MFKNLIEKIVKISQKDETHYKVILFGLVKFSMLKQPYKDRANEIKRKFNYYKNNNIDITTVPKATGMIREIQLVELELLKEFDFVCKQKGFDYWLDFGTLLGAVRHKGFIPWDDDIDVSMPREHYNQIIDAFNSLTRNKYMRARYLRKSNVVSNYFIRIEYINTQITMDIFPYDFYGEVLNDKERNKRNKELKNLREKEINKFVFKNGMSTDEIKEKIENLKNKILVNGYHTKASKTDLVWGVDFNHLWKQWFHKYDTIYPLKEIDFEEFKFNCPNNINLHLKNIFGDFMSYPKDAKHSHMAYRLTEKEMQKIKKYLNEENK